MLGIRSGDCANIPKSSGNHIAWGQGVAMRISSHWSCWAFSSTHGNRAGGGYAYAHSAFQLIDRAPTPMADGSGMGDTNSESCDSTSLQTDPVMGFLIPVSVLGRQMDVETILYLTSGQGVTECLQGRLISQGCVMPGVLSGCPDT